MRTSRPSLRAALALVALAIAAPAALATGAIGSLITEADRTRLDGYEATRAEAVAAARAGGAPADVATLEAVLAAPALPFAGFDPVGDWQCRTIKAGGFVELVVYGWFRCRVSDDGSGWMLEKLTGSQRTKGRFFDDGEARLTYLGSFFVAGDPPPPYGSGADSDQAAFAFRTGDASMRIEFPAPAYESRLDILELRR